MPGGVIALTRAQLLAFRLARKENVVVSGGPCSGKTLLASALAAQATLSGSECLLVGASPQLDRPIPFKTLDGCPTLLLQRAQQGSRTSSSYPDHLSSRARIAPEALRNAQLVLRRALHVLRRHNLSPEDLDLLHPPSQEAADLLAVAAEDAGRVADALWSGNKRAGRSINEVLTVLAGRATEIPPDEQPAYLVCADDEAFENGIRPAPEQDPEEASLAAILADLRNATPPERTIIEVYRNFSRMQQALNDAADLARKYHSLDAAIAANPGAEGAKALDIFARNRPEQSTEAAVSAFDRASGHCELDAKALAPYLPRFGLRTVKSFAPAANSAAKRAVSAEVERKTRTARSSAHQLPGLLSRLQGVFPKEFVAKMVGGPIEDATSNLRDLQLSDPRMNAAAELHELRKLFAATGFGDLFSAPETFVDFTASSRPPAGLPAYDPEFLDLLLELDDGLNAVEDYNHTSWPIGITRARTDDDLAALLNGNRRFGVVVVDDAARYDAELLARLAADDACIHRIGVENAATGLDISSGEADIGSIAMRLAAVSDVGVVCREVSEAEVASLTKSAERLAVHLSAAGYPSTTATDHDAEIHVLADEAADENRLQAFATGGGLVVLCCKLNSSPTKYRPLEGDAHVALSLGWRNAQSFADGVLLEKHGRYVAMVEEPEVITPSDDLVIDLVRRLQDRGWKPVVAWRNAPRSSAVLDALLEARAVVLERRDAVRDIVFAFDLSPPPDRPSRLPDLELAAAPKSPEAAVGEQVPVPAEAAQSLALTNEQEVITTDGVVAAPVAEEASAEVDSIAVISEEGSDDEFSRDLVQTREFQREPLVLPVEAVSEEEVLPGNLFNNE